MNKKVIVVLFSMLASCHLVAQNFESIPVTVGMRVASLRYADVGLPQKGVMPVFQGALMGFVNYDGEEIVPPIYEKDRDALDYSFHNGRMLVRKNGLYGYVNEKGEEVIPCQYEDAMDFQYSLAAVKKNGLWGYVNFENTVVAPFGYKKVYPFSNGRAAVVNELDSVGFIDSFGLLTIPFMYEKSGDLMFSSNGVCKVKKTEGWVYIDMQGNEVEQPLDVSEKSNSDYDAESEQRKIKSKSAFPQVYCPYDELTDLQNGFFLAVKRTESSKRLYGMVSLQSESSATEIIPCEYDKIEGPYSGPVPFFIVQKNNQYGVYSTEGKQILACDYQSISSEGTQLFMLKKNDKYGYANRNGQVVIPPTYEDARPFNDKITAVAMMKKEKMVWNFVNQNGKMVAEPAYEDVATFENGICPVQHKGKWGFINSEGEEISSFKYGYTFSDNEERWSYRWSNRGDLIPVMKEGKYGFIDLNGKEIIKCQYQDAQAFLKGYAQVVKNGKKVILSKDGLEKSDAKSLQLYNAQMNEYLHGKVNEKTISETSFSVKEKKGKWCLIDKNGYQKSGYWFEGVGPIVKNRMTVKVANKWGVVDPFGTFVVPCIYDDIVLLPNDVAIVRVLSKKGLMNYRGTSILTTTENLKNVEWITIKEEQVVVKQD